MASEGRKRKNNSEAYIAEYLPGTDADRIRNITFNLLNSGKKRDRLDDDVNRCQDFENDNDCGGGGDDDMYWDPNEPPRTEESPEFLKFQFLEILKRNEEIVPVKFDEETDWWFREFLNREAENQAICPRDYNALFDKYSNLKTTKRAFSIDMQNVMSQNGINFSQINAIFEVLNRHTTSLNLPILKPNPLLGKKPGSSFIKTNLAAYAGKDHRTVVIDVCEKDCIAYHGIQYNKKTGQMEDFSKLLECPECPTKRYTPCSHPNCKDKSYHQCSPFHQNSDSDPRLGHSNRTPLKTLFYRPITAKLLALYKTSLTPGNEGLLLYFLPKNRVTRDGCTIDINDGQEVKKQMEEMSEAFKSFRERYKLKSDDIVYQCSLLLTMFYDGITMFDRNAESIWPLLVSIASCNPSHRSKLGVGLFLSALHNIKPGSGAEEYFIKNILTEELKVLERGILFKFAHPVTSAEVKVFLQARCIFAHLDLPALEHFVKVQGHASLNGCTLCGDFHGQYSYCLGKVIYQGERGRLSRSHWLRLFGQTKKGDM
jgi:hypothetical protein